MSEEFDVEAWRADMLRFVTRMWWLLFALVIAFWVIFPWKLGWAGVPGCIMPTFALAYARFWLWLGKSGIIRPR